MAIDRKLTRQEQLQKRQKKRAGDKEQAKQSLRKFLLGLKEQESKYTIQYVANSQFKNKDGSESKDFTKKEDYSVTIYIGETLDLLEAGYPCKIFMDGTPDILFYVDVVDYNKLKVLLPKEPVMSDSVMEEVKKLEREFISIKEELKNLKSAPLNNENSVEVNEHIKKIREFIEKISENSSNISSVDKDALAAVKKEAQKFGLELYDYILINDLRERIANFSIEVNKAASQAEIVELKIAMLKNIDKVQDVSVKEKFQKEVIPIATELDDYILIIALRERIANFSIEVDKAASQAEIVELKIAMLKNIGKVQDVYAKEKLRKEVIAIATKKIQHDILAQTMKIEADGTQRYNFQFVSLEIVNSDKKEDSHTVSVAEIIDSESGDFICYRCKIEKEVDGEFIIACRFSIDLASEEHKKIRAIVEEKKIQAKHGFDKVKEDFLKAEDLASVDNCIAEFIQYLEELEGIEEIQEGVRAKLVANAEALIKSMQLTRKKVAEFEKGFANIEDEKAFMLYEEDFTERLQFIRDEVANTRVFNIVTGYTSEKVQAKRREQRLEGFRAEFKEIQKNANVAQQNEAGDEGLINGIQLLLKQGAEFFSREEAIIGEQISCIYNFLVRISSEIDGTKDELFKEALVKIQYEANILLLIKKLELIEYKANLAFNNDQGIENSLTEEMKEFFIQLDKNKKLFGDSQNSMKQLLDVEERAKNVQNRMHEKQAEKNQRIITEFKVKLESIKQREFLAGSIDDFIVEISAAISTPDKKLVEAELNKIKEEAIAEKNRLFIAGLQEELVPIQKESFFSSSIDDFISRISAAILNPENEAVKAELNQIMAEAIIEKEKMLDKFKIELASIKSMPSSEALVNGIFSFAPIDAFILKTTEEISKPENALVKDKLIKIKLEAEVLKVIHPYQEDFDAIHAKVSAALDNEEVLIQEVENYIENISAKFKVFEDKSESLAEGENPAVCESTAKVLKEIEEKARGLCQALVERKATKDLERKTLAEAYKDAQTENLTLEKKLGEEKLLAQNIEASIKTSQDEVSKISRHKIELSNEIGTIEFERQGFANVLDNSMGSNGQNKTQEEFGKNERELKAESKAVEESFHSVEFRIRSIEANISKLEIEQKKVAAEISKEDEEITRLTKENETSQEKIISLKSICGEVEASIEELDLKISGHSSQMGILKEQREKIKAAREKIQSTKEKIEVNERVIHENEIKIGELIAEKELQEGELASLEKGNSRVIGVKSAAISAKEEEIAKLKPSGNEENEKKLAPSMQLEPRVTEAVDDIKAFVVDNPAYSKSSWDAFWHKPTSYSIFDVLFGLGNWKSDRTKAKALAEAEHKLNEISKKNTAAFLNDSEEAVKPEEFDGVRQLLDSNFGIEINIQPEDNPKAVNLIKRIEICKKTVELDLLDKDKEKTERQFKRKKEESSDKIKRIQEQKIPPLIEESERLKKEVDALKAELNSNKSALREQLPKTSPAAIVTPLSESSGSAISFEDIKNGISALMGTITDVVDVGIQAIQSVVDPEKALEAEADTALGIIDADLSARGDGSALLRKKEQARKQLESSQKSMKELNTKIESNEATLASVSGKIIELQSKADKIKEQLEEKTKQKEGLATQKDKFQAEQKAVEEKITKLQEERDAFKLKTITLAKRRDDADRRIGELNGKLRDKKEELLIVESTLKEASAAVTALKDRQQEKEKSILNLQENIAQKQKIIESIRARMGSNSSALEIPGVQRGSLGIKPNLSSSMPNVSCAQTDPISRRHRSLSQDSVVNTNADMQPSKLITLPKDKAEAVVQPSVPVVEPPKVETVSTINVGPTVNPDANQNVSSVPTQKRVKAEKTKVDSSEEFRKNKRRTRRIVDIESSAETPERLPEIQPNSVPTQALLDQAAAEKAKQRRESEEHPGRTLSEYRGTLVCSGKPAVGHLVEAVDSSRPAVKV